MKNSALKRMPFMTKQLLSMKVQRLKTCTYRLLQNNVNSLTELYVINLITVLHNINCNVPSYTKHARWGHDILFSFAHARYKKHWAIYHSFIICSRVMFIPQNNNKKCIWIEMGYKSSPDVARYLSHENTPNVFLNQSEWIMLMGLAVTTSGLPAPTNPTWFHLPSQTKKCFPSFTLDNFISTRSI